jgi:hypothetical protein
MKASLGDQQPAAVFAIAPEAVKRQPWTQPRMRCSDAAEAESAPGPGADSGFVVS